MHRKIKLNVLVGTIETVVVGYVTIDKRNHCSKLQKNRFKLNNCSHCPAVNLSDALKHTCLSITNFKSGDFSKLKTAESTKTHSLSNSICLV